MLRRAPEVIVHVRRKYVKIAKKLRMMPILIEGCLVAV